MRALVANSVQTFYWMPKPTVGSDEVDFVYQTGHAEVVSVEIKSGRNVRARSLRKLVEEGHAPRAYRLSEQNFSGSAVEGTGCTLAGLALYAAFTLGSQPLAQPKVSRVAVGVGRHADWSECSAVLVLLHVARRSRATSQQVF